MSKTKNAIWKWKKTEFVVKTNVSVLCLYLSLELKEMIRKRKEKKLVKSKRKVSCFGCHFKIKNFTMSTCLLLLLSPKVWLKLFREIVFTEKHVVEKTFTRPHHATYCLLSPPPPLLLLCPIFVYMHQKNITFSAAKIHGNIFLSRILTSNIYALSLNPHKKKLRETTLGKKI